MIRNIIKNPLAELSVWKLCKATASSGLRRINDTAKGQRNRQRSIAPKALAEFLALPGSRLERRKAQGDTIVEVMISMTIIAVALAGGYALSGHSLSSATRGQQRGEALALAQSQIEFLKNAYTTLPAAQFGQLYETAPFCFYQDGSFSYAVNSNDLCPNYPQNQTPPSPYNVGISYDNNSNIFTVSANWSSTSGSKQDNLSLYYKLPGQSASQCDPATDPECGPGCEPNCPVNTSDFSISNSASAFGITIQQGNSGTVTVSTTKIGIFNSAITLSIISGGSSGATFTFTPTTIPAPGDGDSKLKIKTTNASAGTYTVKIAGTPASGTAHNTKFKLTILAPSGGGGGGGGCVYNPLTPWITCAPCNQQQTICCTPSTPPAQCTCLIDPPNCGLGLIPTKGLKFI